MITQRELKAVIDARKRAERLAKRPDVMDYLATAAGIEAGLKTLRARAEKGEAQEPGRYEFIREVKTSVTISWEKFWARISALPAVTKALAGCREARELIRQAAERDPAASFAGTRNTVSVDVVEVV
jgi:hypothetical protein